MARKRKTETEPDPRLATLLANATAIRETNEGEFIALCDLVAQARGRVQPPRIMPSDRQKVVAEGADA